MQMIDRKHLRSAALAVFAAALAACGPQQTQPVPETRTDRTTVQFDGVGAAGTMEITRQASIVSVPVAAPPERVWEILGEVYATLELPVDVAESGDRLFVSTNQRMRRIDGERPSRFFQCPGAYENVADSGDLFLTVRTQLLPAPGGTEARIEASAWARASTGGQRVSCTSNGTLEQVIGRRLAEQAR